MKYILILIIGLITITSVYGITYLPNNEFLLTKSEFSELSNEYIAEFMLTNFINTNTTISYSPLGVHVTYKFIGVELIQDTNEIYVYNKYSTEFIPAENLFLCLNYYNINECVYILKNSPETIIINIDGQDHVIESTYYKTFKKGLSEYNNAINIKNSILIEQYLEEFI